MAKGPCRTIAMCFPFTPIATKQLLVAIWSVVLCLTIYKLLKLWILLLKNVSNNEDRGNEKFFRLQTALTT